MMKIFGMLISVVLSGGLVLRDPQSKGLLKYDETFFLQTLTGKANLKTETIDNCKKMCKTISGHFMKCRSWVYDAWTQECHLFKNTNPDFTVKIFDYVEASKIFDKLGPSIQKRISSPFGIRFFTGIDHYRYRTIRNLEFGNPSRSYQYQAAKFLTSEYNDNDTNFLTIRVPALYIAPATFPILGDTFSSTAIWWLSERECSQVCELALGCKAWIYVKGEQFWGRTTSFEGCFLHEKISLMTTTEECYSSYVCSFGIKH